MRCEAKVKNLQPFQPFQLFLLLSFVLCLASCVVRQMFGLYFIKSGVIDNALGKFFTDIYDIRQTGDYDDYIEFNKDDVMDLIGPADDLISKAEDLLQIK